MLVICSTGGTIVSTFDPSAGGLVSSGLSALSGSAVRAALGDAAHDDVEWIELANVGSTNIGFADLRDWAVRVGAVLARDEVEGVVVTMGTNGIEESAFFLDLVTSSSKPVVVTGAMNAPAAISPDGPANISDSLRVLRVAPDVVAGSGVCVVMNSRVHAARFVRKTHANNLEAFESVGGPLLGEVIAAPRRDVDVHAVLPRDELRGAFAAALGAADPWPDVWTMSIGVGSSGAMIDAAVDRGVSAIVIEGFPSGEVSAHIGERIERALDAGVRVVLVPRAVRGRLTVSYGGPGQGRWLHERRVLCSSRLGLAKTRVLVTLALAAGVSLEDVPALELRA
jgi:L-asparaginase